LLKSEANILNVDDILDDLSQITLEMGGQVYILDSETMPSKTSVAAIFRY